MTLVRIRAACWLAMFVLTAYPLRALAAPEFEAERNRMVDEEIVGAGVSDPRVVQSMRDTPRHEFVPLNVRPRAYYDMALPIGSGQTISPPFIVAYMTEQLEPKATDKVLEIGTGSGYQAAVLSPLVAEVYTIEIVESLGHRAASTLKRLKYGNVHAKVGDGYLGWEEHAPFDKIIVTCSPEKVPPNLVEQLREGGRMLVPVGERYQQSLYLFTKRDGKLTKTGLLPVLFVPMTGKAEDRREKLPDPEKPQVANGGFETPAPAVGDDKNTSATSKPDGWYYQRQLKWVEGKDAPEGAHYVTFENKTPGRGAQALQGIGTDGRAVKQLRVSAWVKGSELVPGPTVEQQPTLAITFYDENRAQAGFAFVGPWRDTFDWQHVTEKVRVPPKAREAIIRIGMGGATGQISFDDIRIEKN